MEEKKYFCAANTVSGFVSYYGEIFGHLDRVYIIKGGSGTGKSRFMRDVACAAEYRGAAVEYFYCSFDPSSLDGIIINERLAVIDGTSPHVYEPSLPGAREDLVDLGAFWDSKELRRRRDDIQLLVSEKKKHFSRAYGLLSAYGELEDARASIALQYLDTDALSADAAKRISCLEASKQGAVMHRQTSAFGRDGICRFDTLKNEAEQNVELCDCAGLGYKWIDALKNEAMRLSHSFKVSYDPLVPERPIELLVNGTRFALTVEGGEGLDTFMKKDIEEETYALLRVQNEILPLAVNHLRSASDIHFKIEEIYSSAMDFDKKERFTEKFISNIEI